MTWSTLEDAWGNESQENFSNYYENYQNVNSINVQQPPPQQPPQPPPQPPPQQPPQQPPHNNFELDNRISLLEKNIINNNTNNTFINKKLDNLTIKIESEIKRLNSEFKKLVISIKTVNNNNNNNNLDSYNYQINGETNYFQNMNDIILFVIFGIFIIILMDSMYRILLLKIKNI